MSRPPSPGVSFELKGTIEPPRRPPARGPGGPGLLGVRTWGVSPSGVWEWYRADEYRRVVAGKGVLADHDLGRLRRFHEPAGFGFSEPPRRPALVQVRPLLHDPSGRLARRRLTPPSPTPVPTTRAPGRPPAPADPGAGRAGLRRVYRRQPSREFGVDELQRVIDTSLTNASPLTRRIYANDRWSAAAVQAFINRVMAATIATVRSDGRPHAAVALTACLHGSVIFTATSGSLLLRNLQRQAAVSMTVADRDHDVTVHGCAEHLGTAAELPGLVRELGALSRRGYFLPTAWNGHLYRLRIDRIFLST